MKQSSAPIDQPKSSEATQSSDHQQSPKLIKKQTSALRKRGRPEHITSSASEIPFKRRNHELPHNKHNDDMEEDWLHRRLGLLYSAVASAFADERFKTMMSSFHDTRVQGDEQDGTTFELVAGRLMPFDMTTVSDEMWHVFSHGAVAIKECFREDCETDTAFRSFCTPLEAQIHVQGRIASRRYVEPSRVVLISSSINVPVDAKGHRMSDFVLRSDSFGVICEPQNRQAFPLATPAVVQTQFRQRITISKRKVKAHETVNGEPLAEYIVRAMSETLAQRQQTIENVLLQRSMSMKEERRNP